MGTHEKFFLIEDDVVDAKSIIDELTNAGHKLIRYAGNYQEAIGRIADAKEKGMTIAIVDGNLDYYGEDCADGKEISQLIREQAPGTTIIAYSRSSEARANYGDIYVHKQARKLAEAVTAIPRDQK